MATRETDLAAHAEGVSKTMFRRLLPIALLALMAATPAAAPAHEDERSSADLPLGALDSPVLPQTVRSESGSAPAPAPSAPGRFELVGHDPLLHRGMNSALAITDGYAYVGSRTDGSHANAGVLVVDVRRPGEPRVVHEIGPPEAGMPSESSRELRVIPDQGLLLVLNHACSELIHRCAAPSLTGLSVLRSNIRFYDIEGENAARPKLIGTYTPSRSAPQQPHEFFVWSDPARPGRVLLYLSTPTTYRNERSRPNLIVTEVSRDGSGELRFDELAHWKPAINPTEDDERLHSLTVSHDGRRGYLAFLGGGFLVADFSDFAAGEPDPQVRLVTAVEDRVSWGDPGAHSAVKLPGREHALVTDEVYGKLGGVLSEHGCPWGWVRFIDIGDEARPKLASEYKLPVNERTSCDSTPPDRENFASFSAHNPTLTRHLAFVTWHSAGLQAVQTSNPRRPKPAAHFVPEPLGFVQTEDPALSSGRDKVVMWSFPVIKDGLVYVVDLRNGLYILRYHGPHEEEVARTGYLDGNSNSGDLGRLEAGD